MVVPPINGVLALLVGLLVSVGRVVLVHIGDQPIYDDPIAPFGGVGQSGNGGRFGGDANLEELTQWRWITEQREPASYPF